MTTRMLIIVVLVISIIACSKSISPQKPVISKIGVIACGLAETIPIVYKDRLYSFEYMHQDYRDNVLGRSYFRFVDVATGKLTAPFAEGYHLGSAFVENNRAYVYGVEKWGGETVHVFWSDDLKIWNHQTALNLPGWSIYNNSVCKNDSGYTMALEIKEPAELAGQPFTICFARSNHLFNWEIAPTECVYSKEKYTACPALRFYDGYYYMVYLEYYQPRWYFAPHIVRTKDLIQWENSPFNPIFEPSNEDRQIANPELSTEDRARILDAENCNNSDLEFCEFRDKTVIYYVWGNQRGQGNMSALSKAVFEGSEEQFLKAFF